jgi:hypothetical protein
VPSPAYTYRSPKATLKYNAKLKAIITERDTVRPELVPVLTATASMAER